MRVVRGRVYKFGVQDCGFRVWGLGLQDGAEKACQNKPETLTLRVHVPK